ncbi:hypothetical protein NL676_029683 [Syzygium grande]|nr:hypothetical protein NL676_029683 [Syzygium grande]
MTLASYEALAQWVRAAVPSTMKALARPSRPCLVSGRGHQGVARSLGRRGGKAAFIATPYRPRQGHHGLTGNRQGREGHRQIFASGLAKSGSDTLLAATSIW